MTEGLPGPGSDEADVLSLPVEGVLSQGSVEGPLTDAEWNDLLEGPNVIQLQGEVAKQVAAAVTASERQVG
jgi:hypothetical protein